MAAPGEKKSVETKESSEDGDEMVQFRLMGDPILRERAPEVTFDVHDDGSSTRRVVWGAGVKEGRQLLHRALAQFRKKHGFGRGTAAPQVGWSARAIVINLGDDRGAFTLHNPEITWRSEATFTLWDDCMSFPDLLVKVRRAESISIKYIDDDGRVAVLEKVDRSLSELLQHEIDHLDGILSIDRAEGPPPESVIYRRVFDATPAVFEACVDYTIAPTI